MLAVFAVIPALAAQVDLMEKNPKTGALARRSMKLDFSDYDEADPDELNEILWKSVRGAHSPMPPPVRAGFIRIIEEEEAKEKEGTAPRK